MGYAPPPIYARNLEDQYIELFKAGDARAARIFRFAEELVGAGRLTISEVAKYANDVLSPESIATIFQEVFSVGFVASVLNDANMTISKAADILESTNISSAKTYNILAHANLAADKTQSILYNLPFTAKLFDIITHGAGDLTVSADTSISGVNRYNTLTVNAGITLTITGQPGALIVKTLSNSGTITKSITGGAGGAAAPGAGAGGQGGGGLVIFASNLENLGVISADGENGGDGGTTTTYGDGGNGGSGVFYRVGTDEPGLGGDGAYDTANPDTRGDGGRNGGGGGSSGSSRAGGDGDGSSYTTFASYGDLADEIRQSVIDWFITNVIGKSPSSTISIPNVYGSGGGGGGSDGGSGCGGGGGGGGGEILTLCLNLDNGGTIRANAGSGGNGGTEGAKDEEGGGGGGGLVYILYKVLVSTGTLQANGGVAGTGDSYGTAATAGTTGVATAQAV